MRGGGSVVHSVLAGGLYCKPILLTVYFSEMNQFNYLKNKITLSSQYFDVSNRFRSVSPNCFCTDLNYCLTCIPKDSCCDDNFHTL